MLWVATERAAYLAIGGVLFAAGAYLAFHLFGHVHDRVDIWLDPWHSSVPGDGQIIQGTYALAWGGLLGHRARPRRPVTRPRGAERLHLLGHR